MTTIDIDEMAIFPDPNTEAILLPSWLQESSNFDKLHHMKIALRIVMRDYLTEEQRNILFWHYKQNKSKTQIGKIIGTTPSNVCKKISTIQSKIKEYVGFYIKIYEIVEKEHSYEQC